MAGQAQMEGSIITDAMVTPSEAEMEGSIVTFAEMLSFLQRKYDCARREHVSVCDKMCALEDELKAKMPKPYPSKIFSTPGFNRNSRADKTVTEGLTNLERQLTQLEEKLREIAIQKDVVKALQYKQENIGWLIPEIIVIAFVNDLEKADQYFDFKDYLRIKRDIKLDSIPVLVTNKLVMDEEVRTMFDKLDKEFIGRAVYAIKWERTVNDVRSRRAKYIDFLKASNTRRKNGDLACLEEDFERKADIYYPTSNSNEPEEMDREAFLDPISNLVYYTREKVHVMDEEPKEELQKIDEFDDFYFARHVQLVSPRAELKRIMSIYKYKPHEDVLAAIRTELYQKALERYHAFRKKYTKEHTADAEKPVKDELMPDNNLKRASSSINDGESSSSQSRRSVRLRTRVARSYCV